MGAPFPAALGAPPLPSCSAATCKRQKVAAGRHQCKSNFFRLPSPGGIFANQLPGWLRISTAANFASLTPTFPTPALLPSFPPAGARSGMTAHQSGGARCRATMATMPTKKWKWRCWQCSTLRNSGGVDDWRAAAARCKSTDLQRALVLVSVATCGFPSA